MARDLSRNRKKTIHINRYLENKIEISRMPIPSVWQCSCKERIPGFRLAKRPPHPRPHDMGIRQILYQHPGARRRLAWCCYP